jgi:hypothetical protein
VNVTLYAPCYNGLKLRLFDLRPVFGNALSPMSEIGLHCLFIWTRPLSSECAVDLVQSIVRDTDFRGVSGSQRGLSYSAAATTPPAASHVQPRHQV